MGTTEERERPISTLLLPPAGFLARVMGTVPERWGKRGSEVQRDTPEKTLATVSQGINPSDPRGQLSVACRAGNLESDGWVIGIRKFLAPGMSWWPFKSHN